MPARKIATCCYCGTRAALVIDKGRHELACASCGAPLHDLKQMPAPAGQIAKTTPHREAAKPAHPRMVQEGPKRPNKQKKRKRRGRKLFEELWDVVEDIFD